ncbi:dienelactone hydrolase family protein [Kribbella monticola]|uniref:dienelactone hydrolase family protein n=1 Tax=Kribbella monticola TaxID=2185285 RepID=UPI000DD31197|nr:alpha/beta fold hydrolase [Kribbella monticola]
MTDAEPWIDLLAAPAGATDLVLLAHGGVVDSFKNPHSWRAPLLRMWPFATAARSAAPGAAVGLMRYRYRGWNGAAASPAADLRTVLDGLPPRIRRVVLIGHSMGGRAVVAAGNHPLVSGVLALAPWLPPGEPLVPLRGLVVFAHGTLDRITSPAQTAAYARRLRSTGIPVAMLTVDGDKHAMLHRAADWNTLVHRFTTAALSAHAEPADCDALTTDPGRTDPLPAWNGRASLSSGIASIAKARFGTRLKTW